MKKKQWIILGAGLAVAGVTTYLLFFNKKKDNAFTGKYKTNRRDLAQYK